MVAINGYDLFWRQIGRDMSEITMTEIIATLDDVLENILHIAEKTGRNTFPTDFIECLPASYDILLDTGIASFGKHSGYEACIRDSESIFPSVFSKLPGQVLISVAHRRSHNATEFSHDFKHGGFTCAYVSP